MSFRTRLVLVAAGAVAVVVVLASAITYAIVRDELRGQVDDSLRARAASMQFGVHTESGACSLIGPTPSFGEPNVAVQFHASSGPTQFAAGLRIVDALRRN